VSKEKEGQRLPMSECKVLKKIKSIKPINPINSIKSINSVRVKIPKLGTRIRGMFTRPNVFAISLFALLSRSLSFTWIFWDALLSHKLYKHQQVFPDQALRFVRLGVGIGWFVGLINPLTAGIILAADGIYSIAHYRHMRITKNFIEDVPRIARICVGLLLVPAVGLI